MLTKLKNTRTVTYRKGGTPAIILEGKWLEKLYGWKIGDQISVEYGDDRITLRNVDAEIREIKKPTSRRRSVDTQRVSP